MIFQDCNRQYIKTEIRNYDNKEFRKYILNLNTTEISHYSLWKATKKEQDQYKLQGQSKLQQEHGKDHTKNKRRVMADNLQEVFTNKSPFTIVYQQ